MGAGLLCGATCCLLRSDQRPTNLRRLELRETPLGHIDLVHETADIPFAVCHQDGGAFRTHSYLTDACLNVRRSTTPVTFEVFGAPTDLAKLPRYSVRFAIGQFTRRHGSWPSRQRCRHGCPTDNACALMSCRPWSRTALPSTTHDTPS